MDGTVQPIAFTTYTCILLNWFCFLARCRLRQLRSSSHQLIGAEATAAKERAAADSARQSFVEDVPPTRASGSRTAITDEELERQAALGDIKAERMLSNRNSARESRRRKWNEWNETRLSYEIAKAACRALAPIVAGAHFPLRASTPPTPERCAGSSAASVVSSASSDASVATATPGAAPEGDEDVFSIRAEFAQAFGAVSAAASSRRLFPCTSSASSPSYPSSSHQARTRGPSPLTALPAFSSELALSQSAELGIPVDSAEVDGAATPLAMAA